MPPPRFRPQVSALEGRAVPAALLQVINDSPYPQAAAVDVYINNLLIPELTNLGFRRATPYLTQPSAVPLVVSVRAAGATAATPPFLTQTFNLADNSATVAVGLGDPTAAPAAATRFQLLATPAARTQAATPGNAEFTFVNGSPDAPPLDVKVRQGATVATGAAYAGLAPGYTSVTPGQYVLDVGYNGSPFTPSGLFDLRGSAGKAVTVLASGFTTSFPPGTAAGNGLRLLAVNGDGTAALLPTANPAGLPGAFAVGGPGKASLYDGTGKLLFTVSPFGPTVEARPTVLPNGVMAVGSGPGVPAQVRFYDPAGAEVQFLQNGTASVLAPFEGTFTGGVSVAADPGSAVLSTQGFRTDYLPVFAVTPDRGGGPVVVLYTLTVFNGSTPLTQTSVSETNRFFGIEDVNFRGGARAAFGDVSGDGRSDLVVAAGFGGGPRVAVFNGTGLNSNGATPARVVGDFFVFEPTLRNGVFVAAGDVNGDGAADILVGGGPGGGPRVFGLSGAGLVAGKQVTVADFFAGDPNNRDGVRLAAKDLDGDLNADLVVGLGAAGTPQVRGFRGKDFAASVTGTAPPAVAALDLNPFTNPGLVYVG